MKAQAQLKTHKPCKYKQNQILRVVICTTQKKKRKKREKNQEKNLIVTCINYNAIFLFLTIMLCHIKMLSLHTNSKIVIFPKFSLKIRVIITTTYSPLTFSHQFNAVSGVSIKCSSWSTHPPSLLSPPKKKSYPTLNG